MLDYLANHGPDLVSRYGYLAIAVLTFFEGETVVVLAGLAAHNGYLDFNGVVLAAFAGTFFGDQLYFHIGRRHGRRVLDWRPAWRPAADRALRLLQRYDTGYILAFRFLYGLRTISPFVIGMGPTSTLKYLCLNVVSGAVWAAAFTALGYLSGRAVEAVIANLPRYELFFFLFLAVLGGTGLAWLWWQRRRELRRLRATEPNEAEKTRQD